MNLKNILTFFSLVEKKNIFKGIYRQNSLFSFNYNYYSDIKERKFWDL